MILLHLNLANQFFLLLYNYQHQFTYSNSDTTEGNDTEWAASVQTSSKYEEQTIGHNNEGNADSNDNEHNNIDDDENPFLVHNDDDENSGFGKIDNNKVRNFYGK